MLEVSCGRCGIEEEREKRENYMSGGELGLKRVRNGLLGSFIVIIYVEGI